MPKMPTSRAHILPLILLILISDTKSLSPATAPTHSPATAPKRTPVSAPPLPPIPAPAYLPPSPAFAGPNCATALLNLTSCLTFVEQGANLTVPEKGCCSSFAGLVDSNPICLCQLLSSSNTYGLKIDETKALMLPTVCHVQTPPVSLCNALGIPVPSPGALTPGGGGGAAEPSALGIPVPSPGALTPSGGGGGGAAEPSGSGQLAPANSIAAAPSAGGDGGSTAGITSLQLALLAILSQVVLISF